MSRWSRSSPKSPTGRDEGVTLLLVDICDRVTSAETRRGTVSDVRILQVGNQFRKTSRAAREFNQSIPRDQITKRKDGAHVCFPGRVAHAHVCWDASSALLIDR